MAYRRNTGVTIVVKAPTQGRKTRRKARRKRRY